MLNAYERGNFGQVLKELDHIEVVGGYSSFAAILYGLSNDIVTNRINVTYNQRVLAELERGEAFNAATTSYLIEFLQWYLTGEDGPERLDTRGVNKVVRKFLPLRRGT